MNIPNEITIRMGRMGPPSFQPGWMVQTDNGDCAIREQIRDDGRDPFVSFLEALEVSKARAVIALSKALDKLEAHPSKMTPDEALGKVEMTHIPDNPL